MGFFSRGFLVFLMKDSKKRRRKQPQKLMAGQFAWCLALNEPLESYPSARVTLAARVAFRLAVL